MELLKDNSIIIILVVLIYFTIGSGGHMILNMILLVLFGLVDLIPRTLV